MIICCHQELLTQYPQPSMCVQKVQKVAVPIKRLQDISAGCFAAGSSEGHSV